LGMLRSRSPTWSTDVCWKAWRWPLERRFEPFSQGRGSITQQRVEEIEAIAARHAIYLAPLEIIPLLPWQCCNNPQT
jgi:hypothetical protein